MHSNYFTNNQERFLNELLELLRIPSISADSAYKPDVIAAANYIKDKLIAAGADKV
jgi:acetylornithine deacetylase/succinyl-diaminopimelate desuccinylase-like protein